MPPRKQWGMDRIWAGNWSGTLGNTYSECVDRCRRNRQMRDAGEAAITIMAELELVAPVVIEFLVAAPFNSKRP